MTAILMIGLFSTAQASVNKTTGQPKKVEMKADNTCPYRNAEKLKKAEHNKNYSAYLNETPARPAVKSAPAKSADGVKKRS